MHPSYGPPNRDDDNVFFGARSRSDAGSRRWRHKGLLLQSTTVLARTRRFLDSRACKPKVGLRTPLTAHSSAIAPEREREQMAALAERRDRMAALARREHERAARSLPAAALPQRAFSENTTKRDIPTFVRARIREFEAVLPRPFYLWSVRRASRWRHRLASTATRRSSRIEGVTALVRRRRASAS